MKISSLLGVSQQSEDFLLQMERQAQPQFAKIDANAHYNQAKVLHAFAKQGIVAGHFQPSTGYGYSDIGRDALEALFATAFGAQEAIVRPHIVSGTHALAMALQGLLAPGQTLLYASGKPYDTLEQVIGLEPTHGSLMERGVQYEQIDLLADGSIDLDALRAHLLQSDSIAVVALQRSAGYAWRRALCVDELREAAALVHAIRPQAYVFVDNCYGEFTERQEPTEVGVDVIAGSLIKNAGGGIAPTGGYVCGTRKALERVESALNAPGIGRACGSYEASYRPFFQGLFMAPTVVASAVKTAVLFAHTFAALGYDVNPAPQAVRTDIIQCIRLKEREKLLTFCRAIQQAAPVDSMAVPEPWAMPGYTHEVVMAAGAFVQGSSIELSADGPLCEPFTAYMQGGLTYAHGRLGCLYAIDAMREL